MLQAGRVRVNGQTVIRANQSITADDQVDVSDRAERAHEPSKPELPGLIYEDADVLVVNKPPGLLTSTVTGERRPTLAARVRAYVAAREPRARVGVIHRLDRGASGLLVFSKNDDAFRALKSQFYHHTVTREYRAVVHGTPEPPAGRIETRLVERTDGTVRSTRQSGRGQPAITDYEVLQTAGRMALVRVVLQTGRKHQIRAHLRERGHPVVGDVLYGPEVRPAARLMLAATRLAINQPRTGLPITFEIPIPPEFPLGVEGPNQAAR